MVVRVGGSIVPPGVSLAFFKLISQEIASMKTLSALIGVALLALVLTACSGSAASDMVHLYAIANTNGDAPASHATVQWNGRVHCDPSSLQMVLNAIDADLKVAAAPVLSITTDQWLDQHMGQFTCIKEQ
jgi:hypothetical protein